MRMIIVEKHPDFNFDSTSTATFKINSMNLPDLKINGVVELKYPLNMVPMSGTLDNLEAIVHPHIDLLYKGVIMLCSWIEGDYLKIFLNGSNVTLKDGSDAFRVTFVEKVAIKAVAKNNISSNAVEAIEVAKKPKKKGKK